MSALIEAYELNRVEERFAPELRSSVRKMLELPVPGSPSKIHRIVEGIAAKYSRNVKDPTVQPQHLRELLWYHFLKQSGEGSRRRALEAGGIVPGCVASLFHTGGVPGLVLELGEHLKATEKGGVVYVCGVPGPDTSSGKAQGVQYLSRDEFRALTSE